MELLSFLLWFFFFLRYKAELVIFHLPIYLKNFKPTEKIQG